MKKFRALTLVVIALLLSVATAAEIPPDIDCRSDVPPGVSIHVSMQDGGHATIFSAMIDKTFGVGVETDDAGWWRYSFWLDDVHQYNFSVNKITGSAALTSMKNGKISSKPSRYQCKAVR